MGLPPAFSRGASAMASEVDHLYFFLLAVSAVFIIGIFGAITFSRSAIVGAYPGEYTQAH